ncbi:MAG TPA: chemotaxis protein MotC [Mesorhizobium sp.]|jgi:chemotaxis protein MotC|uniref:chemotaxis protein MotC n=1 Tax=Mesorhizobium sp. TaxID=1871066 RepID=UPI002DDCBF9E|nr:chemotaxis protein MotC [Mesorhizobium sp.]HEV2507081.1 chemotaxis protein MotC [Mesorhizobium sp.]
MTRAARILGLTLLGLGVATSALAQDPLQPYQMVRSLQLVQDRLASGDHAALPMQNKLLEMADARFRASKPDDFKEPKNLRALLVYGMSGGNPATVRGAAGRIQLDQTNQAIVDGILDYLGGQPGPAIAALQPIDPMTLSPDVGAFVALIKGSLLAIDNPVQALTLLDQARLLSPGTLVEEAALRRSVAIATTNGDAARFAQASTQYVERYLLSPYASQFADSFVAGVVTLHMALSQDKLADITSMMDTERERVIYLRIARRAAIDGLNDLSAFASTKAIPQDKGATQADDPRAELYANLSSITSATVDDIRAKLKTIDRSRLSPSDRSLLDAAQQITQEVVAPPIPAVFDLPPSATARPQPNVAAQEKAGAASDPAGKARTAAAQDDGSDLPLVEDAISERPATEMAAEPAETPLPATQDAAIQPPPATILPASANGGSDTTDAAIANTKRKLDKIDLLLGASPQ